MIVQWLSQWQSRRALKAWMKTAVGVALARHTNEYFTQFPRLADLTQPTKDKLIDYFYKKVFEIYQSAEPVSTMREALVSAVLVYAKFKVLSLTETEKSESGDAECPYISGELYHHIQRATKISDELGELVWKEGAMSDEELISFCNSKCVVMLYNMNGLNLVRADLNDIDDEKDWLRPFVQAMLIWHEDQVRNKLELPSLHEDRLGALKYSLFMNMVVNGHRNPYYEWDKEWGEART